MTPAKAKRERFDRTMVTDSRKCFQNADDAASKEMSDDPLYM